MSSLYIIFQVLKSKQRIIFFGKKDEINAQAICTAKYDAKSKFICLFKDWKNMKILKKKMDF